MDNEIRRIHPSLSESKVNIAQVLRAFHSSSTTVFFQIRIQTETIGFQPVRSRWRWKEELLIAKRSDYHWRRRVTVTPDPFTHVLLKAAPIVRLNWTQMCFSQGLWCQNASLVNARSRVHSLSDTILAFWELAASFHDHHLCHPWDQTCRGNPICGRHESPFWGDFTPETFTCFYFHGCRERETRFNRATVLHFSLCVFVCSFAVGRNVLPVRSFRSVSSDLCSISGTRKEGCIGSHGEWGWGYMDICKGKRGDGRLEYFFMLDY